MTSTRKASRKAEREAHQARMAEAARILGARGGAAGKGSAKRRGDSAHYRAMVDKYTSDGEHYEAVCGAIGWRTDVHAVRVLRRGQVYHVRGTALKPDEWRQLASHDREVLPTGMSIRVHGVPAAAR